MTTWTDHQREAIFTTGMDLCVDAGAGSGKTSVLIERIITLLDKRMASLDEIVAITFTDAAAAEMKARLRLACHAIAPEGDARHMTYWRSIERRADTARISTIHSFCSSVMRENALSLGFDPDFAVLVEGETHLLLAEVIESALHELLNAGDEDALHAAAALGMNQLTESIQALIKKGALLERLAEEHPLDDADKLAQHWEGLVAKSQEQRLLAARKSSEVLSFIRKLESFEGLCSKETDGREKMRLGMLGALRWIADAEEASLVETQLGSIDALKATGTRKTNWDSPETVDALSAIQKAVKDWVKSLAPPEVDPAREIEAARLTTSIYGTYAHVAEALREAKHERNGLCFDDLIEGALKILRDNEHVRQRMARSIKYLLIDEFQDTDSAQLQIARLLSAEEKGPELFIVGDAKQSIYGFRGADVDVFLDAQGQAGQVIPLAKNFRTVPDVLEFINHAFAQSGLLHAVEPEYGPLQADRPPAEEARVEFLIPEELEDANVKEYRQAEAKLIAARILEICSGTEGAFVGNADERRPAGFGDVAILFRSMSSVYIYEEELRKLGIPYSVVAGKGFYERQEVTDLANLLTVIVDPFDEPALLGFLRGPMGAMSDESLLELCQHGEPLSELFLGQSVPEGFEQAEEWQRARNLIEDLRRRQEMPLQAFLDHVLDSTGFEAILLNQFLGIQKAGNIRKLCQIASSFSRGHQPHLREFVRYIAEVVSHGLQEGDAPIQREGDESVTLMTVHKSKGLEFPIVVLPDTGRKLGGSDSANVGFHTHLGLAAKVVDGEGESKEPAIRQMMTKLGKDAELAEHARLLYVAMTRAKDWLLLAGTPEPKKNSWMATFEELHGLAGRAHGASLSASGWEATVRRRPANVDPLMTDDKAERELDKEVITRRANPISPSSTHQHSFSVSALLDAMDPEHAGADDSGASGLGEADFAGKVDGMDPMLRGTLVHRMFELWDFETNTAPDIGSMLQRDCPALGLRQRLEADLLKVAEVFRNSDMCKQMRTEKVAHRERPFILRIDENFVKGTIDAVLKDGTLIDYKTGKQNPKHLQRYETQLLLYALAVRKLSRRVPERAAIYFADAGETVEVAISSERIDETERRLLEAILVLRQ